MAHVNLHSQSKAYITVKLILFGLLVAACKPADKPAERACNNFSQWIVEGRKGVLTREDEIKLMQEVYKDAVIAEKQNPEGLGETKTEGAISRRAAELLATVIEGRYAFDKDSREELKNQLEQFAETCKKRVGVTFEFTFTK